MTPEGRGQNVPPIVLLVGTEAWLQEEAVRRLIAQCVAPSTAALDAITFTGDEASPATILAAARTPPLAGPRRLVVVRGVGEVDAEALEWLRTYAEAPTLSTCLVVVLTQPLPPALKGALKTVAVEIPCQPLKGGALVAWVRESLQRRWRKTIGPEAVQALLARVGPDLGALTQRLEHVALYVGARPTITGQDVQAIVGWSVEDRVFAVVDAAIRRDRVSALRITRRLLEEEGVAPEELLGALGHHLRRVWHAVRRLDAGESPREAVQAVGVPWYVQEPFTRLITRLTVTSATVALERLLEADHKLKSGGAPPWAVLEPCVWELAGAAGVPQAAAGAVPGTRLK